MFRFARQNSRFQRRSAYFRHAEGVGGGSLQGDAQFSLDKTSTFCVCPTPRWSPKRAHLVFRSTIWHKSNWPQATSQERLGASHTNKKASRRGGGGVGARCTERAVRSIWDAQTRQASEEEEEEEEEESGLDAQSVWFGAHQRGQNVRFQSVRPGEPMAQPAREERSNPRCPE